jgi:hypothetical protein
MSKQAISVTLEVDNLRWLQGQAAATKARGLSETLDRIVTSARLGGHVHAASVRSVAGTIEINPDDPDLDRADEYVRAMTETSLRRPFLARETGPGSTGTARPRTPRKARRRG